ncbi:ROK family protein [Kitasatospora sp. NPDC006697]|uniref:ROK family protein n=1 Tax=Kitasatospora sp. NPDC006697 TaxID=3364020 RepID=UPI00367BED00
MPAPDHRTAPRTGDDRRDTNAATVLRTVLDHGPAARGRIAALSGLSPAAVSRQVATLTGLGLLRERPDLAAGGGVGRPQLPLDIDTGTLAVAGVHVGVPFSTVALLDLRGNVLCQEQLDNGGRTGPAVLEPLLRRLPAFLAAARRPLIGLGAVSGGAVDPARGVTVRHVPLDWHELPLGPMLAGATGLPVRVDNHARALAETEILYGLPAARRSLLHLFVGHVVDAALGIGGLVHLGHRSATGDIAHLRVAGSREPCDCGRRGCFGAAASDTALYRDAAAAGVIERPDRNLMIAAVRSGDRRADRLVLRRARMIGQVLALLVDVVNPELVLLSETFAVLDPRYLDAVRHEAARRSRLFQEPEQLIAQRRGEDTLAVAGGTPVLSAVYRDPLRTVGPPR